MINTALILKSGTSLFLMCFLLACGGGSSSSEDTNQATNLKPISTISPSANQSINVGDIIDFKGDTSSDPDGNTPLTYQWNLAGAATSIQSSTAINPGEVTFSEVGSVTVSLIVKDSLGLASTEKTMSVEVNAVNNNEAPVGNISHDNANGSTGSTNDVTITEGAEIVFDSSITDPEGDAISYSWSFEGGNPEISTSANNIMVSFSTVGSFSVSLVATDAQGNSSSFPSTPLTITVVAQAIALPTFKSLPILTASSVNGVAQYTLNAEENVDVTVDSPDGSWITPMMRYNDLPLQPVILAKRGDEVEITVSNHLTGSNEETTVHWHGFKIPGVEDGGPDFPIAVNASRTYRFTMNQAAAPLWFHPHAHGTTATQVYKGLAGAFILTDDITQTLENTNKLPTGDNDVALLVQDREFADDPNNTGRRNLVYSNTGANGMLGNRVLVNGVEMPALEVTTSQYRFRLLNGSNARTYDFALGNSSAFYVVSTDGGLLNEPALVDHIMLAAGERAEIIIDFGESFRQNIKLISREFSAGGGGSSLANGALFDVMRFDVNVETTDPVVLYTSLPSEADINSRLTEAMSDASRTFVMSMSGMGGGGMQFLINDKVFDIDRIDEVVPSGATEIWEISNTSNIAHPFHAHAIQWQILDRGTSGGSLTPSTGIDLGWKDTVLVQPNETVRFIGQFDPIINVGKYMYHCHILEHEDNGMMGTFEVVQ